jgi:hypothetical protein
VVVTKQVALIARWHAKAIDTGTRLLALSCFDRNRFVAGRNAIEDDLFSFQSLDLEFTVEVIDGLHEYCFTLRKLIERAGKVALAKKLFPHSDRPVARIGQGGLEEREVQLCPENLWWILGRVIHSKSVMVLGGDYCYLRVYEDGKTREFKDGRVYVEVASDFDEKEGLKHILHVPSLVRAYAFSHLSYEIGQIVRENTL